MGTLCSPLSTTANHSPWATWASPMDSRAPATCASDSTTGNNSVTTGRQCQACLNCIHPYAHVSTAPCSNLPTTSGTAGCGHLLPGSRRTRSWSELCVHASSQHSRTRQCQLPWLTSTGKYMVAPLPTRLLSMLPPVGRGGMLLTGTLGLYLGARPAVRQG